jgi:hypothetical protein
VCMVTASHQFTQPAQLAHSTLELAAAELLPLTRKLKLEPKVRLVVTGKPITNTPYCAPRVRFAQHDKVLS